MLPFVLGEVVYCDDDAIPVIASADGLVDKVASVVQIARVMFSSFWLMLNFGNNKTNVVPFVAGHGSVTAKQKYE